MVENDIVRDPYCVQVSGHIIIYSAKKINGTKLDLSRVTNNILHGIKLIPLFGRPHNKLKVPQKQIRVYICMHARTDCAMAGVDAVIAGLF